MPSSLFEYQLRIRNVADTADALVVTSVRGGTNPWLSSAPTGDGQEFDPVTGKSRCGAFTGQIADGITSGTDRVVTAQLEDANFRQQLMDRRAFVEYRQDGGAWNVLIAGFLTTLRLISGIEYEYTVSDPTRAEHDYTAFKPRLGGLTLTAAVTAGTTLTVEPLTVEISSGTRLFLGAGYIDIAADAAIGATSVSVSTAVTLPSGASFSYSESLATFLTRWPNRGCVLGGPVRGGFLNQPDRGGWEMTVEKSTDTFLRFNAGYAPPKFDRSTNAEECAAAANAKTDGLVRSSWSSTPKITTTNEANVGRWPGLVVELVGTGYFQPDPGLTYNASVSQRMDADGPKHLVKDIRDRGIYLSGTSATPAAATKVRVRAFTFEASEISPIYWTGHPADLLALLWTEAGLSYSSAAITTVKQAVGTNRVVSFRITEAQPLGTFLEQNIYAPFGIGVRTNASGQLEAFSARIPYATAPSTEITSADVDTDEAGSMPEIFAIDQATAVKKITFSHQRLIRTDDVFDASSPDGFVVQDEQFERVNGDPGAVGNREATFTVDGMVHSTDSANPNTSSLVDALALEIFDRYGRGLITGELPLLRGGSGDSAVLGDEIINKIPQLPNHNKRLGDDNSVSGRAMQIVRLTFGPRGNRVKLADSGPNAQPYATQPTLSIAASSSFPRSVAEVTVTNASTLNTDTAGLRLQWAVTTGSTPAATDYTDVAAYPGGGIPTIAIPLPAVTAGRKVYARAVATKVGKRPSSWSTVVSVTLTAITAPSSLSVTPSGSDGSIAAAAWTVGDATMVTDCFLRASGAPSSDAVLQRTLPEGSTKFTIEGLTPSSAYTFGVRHRDARTGDVSTTTETTFTAGASTLTLSAPVYPFGFCGERDPETGAPLRDGIFGIGVVAASFPGFIEVAVATETSVGSGSYGAFATSGRVMPNVLGNWTTWQDTAPNDGLRRQLKARHVRDGATASSYTSVVTVTPWTPQALPTYPTNIITSVVVNAPPTDLDAQQDVSVTVSAVDPSGGSTKVALTALTSNSSVISGNSVGTYGSSPQTWILARPGVLKGSAVAQFKGDDASVTGARASSVNVDIPEQGQQGAPVMTLTVKEDGHVEVTLAGNNDTLSYTTAESTSSMPADATAIAGTVRNGSVVTFTSTATLTLGGATQRYYMKAVSWPQTSAGGTHGQIVSGTVDRQNKNTTGKRIAFSAVLVADAQPGFYTYTRGTSGISMTGGTGTFLGYAVLTLPDGITLTGFDSYTVRFTGGTEVAKYTFLKVTRSSGATSTLATHTNNTSGSAQLITTSGLSEVIDNSTYAYIAQLDLDSTGGSLGLPSVGGADFGATYTSPDLSKSY